MDAAELLPTLREMSPRSRVRALESIGFEKSEWEKLLETSAAAAAEVATDDRAARMTKWTAIVRFVIEYYGLARAFSALEFLNEKHEIWCNQIIDLTPGIVIRTNFEKEYADLVGAHLEVEDWLRQMMARVKERSDMLTEPLSSDR